MDLTQTGRLEQTDVLGFAQQCRTSGSAKTRKETQMNQPAGMHTNYQPTDAEKAQRAYRMALDLYRQRPGWVTFFREILGVDGAINSLFVDRESLNTFETTEENAAIQQMLAQLRETDSTQEESREPTKVITVRLPRSLHESLRAEAHSRNTSMNKLCITKLLNVLAEEEAVAAAAAATG